MAKQTDALDWLQSGWQRSGFLKTIPGIGTGLDVDGAYGLQCFDFVNAYSIEMGWGRLSGRFAADLWTTAPAGFQRVQDPELGDIFVYAADLNGGAGHTGVVVGGTRDNFRSVDQNWFNSSNQYGSPPANVTHNANHLLGFLRPQLSKENQDMATMVDRSMAAYLYDKILKRPIKESEYAYWVGKDIVFVLHAIADSPEAQVVDQKVAKYDQTSQPLTDAAVLSYIKERLGVK